MSPGDESSQFAQRMVEAISLLADAFAEHHLPHALIGGMAVAYRAIPRATMDLDFIVGGDSIQVGRVLSMLVEHGFEPDTKSLLQQWGSDHMAVMWRGPVRVDWLKPVVGIYQHVLDCAEPLTAFGKPISVASVEGLILCKPIANRPQDQADVVSLVKTHPGAIDLAFIEREWQSVGDLGAPQLQSLKQLIENTQEIGS